MFKIERKIVTKMGQKLIPKLAKTIAGDRYTSVYLDHRIHRHVEGNKRNVIEKIINELRYGRRKPDLQKEIVEISKASGGEIQYVELVADLYIDDIPLFLEIKTPLPNLDICVETKRKLLFRIISDRNPEAYLGLYYNPYFPEEYSHSITMRVMDIKREVLIGEEMWDRLGGEGTFDELLEIMEEVRKELRISTS